MDYTAADALADTVVAAEPVHTTSGSHMQQTDVAIIGGGIVGLATAYRLLERFPDRTVTILEKEREVAQHQTGHNSGVLHSGIYYRPGSLRATNCREGKLAMEQFCQKENIPFNRCGKVIVAVSSSEIPQLERIHERGLANDIRCERIGPERLKELEPHVAGVQAIHVPEAGIVDYRQVAERLAERIKEKGGVLKMSATSHGERAAVSTADIRNPTVSSAVNPPKRGFDSVTVPGAVASWVAMSERFGKLPFAYWSHPFTHES